MSANDPAYPSVEHNGDGSHYNDRPGLTKRELFAAMAMQGFVSADDYQHVMLGRHYQLDDFAASSVRIADALIAALEKTND